MPTQRARLCCFFSHTFISEASDKIKRLYPRINTPGAVHYDLIPSKILAHVPFATAARAAWEQRVTGAIANQERPFLRMGERERATIRFGNVLGQVHHKSPTFVRFRSGHVTLFSLGRFS